MAADVFISYSSKDREQVSLLATELGRAGFCVWWDPEIAPGQRYEQVIEDALRNAKAVVVCWSKNSIQSEWVYEEADHAKLTNKLVPLFLDDCQAPIGFRMRQGAKFENWNGEHSSEWNSLLKSLEPLIGKAKEEAKATKQTSNTATRQNGVVDLKYSLTVSLEEAYAGKTTQITVPYELIGGEKTYSVKVPPGVDTGTRIRLRDLGDGQNGAKGARGDLYIFIEVAEHPLYERDGNNLLARVPIQFPTAVLGGELEFATIDGGRVVVFVPEGSQSGRQLRLKGKGMPSVSNPDAFGDLYIELQLVTPVKLDQKQRQLIETLRSLLPKDVS